MPDQFISEPITPVDASFDATRMSFGEPGLPRVFRWRDREWLITEVLETWKEHGDCTHGSGERYVRKHGFRVRTADGYVMKLYFQRKYGKVHRKESSRWWIYSMEQPEKSLSGDVESKANESFHEA